MISEENSGEIKVVVVDWRVLVRSKKKVGRLSGEVSEGGYWGRLLGRIK